VRRDGRPLGVYALDRVCVFAGSRLGNDARYAAAAHLLADALARRGLSLVYGGTQIGLMGALADRALSAGVPVIGVLPRALSHVDFAHPGLDELRIVDDMHERKMAMAQLADAFIALPGGLGTLEETCEMLTWTDLGLQRKPVGLLDVAGYWRHLEDLLDAAANAGFVTAHGRRQLIRSDDPDKLLDHLTAWRPPPIDPRVSIPTEALAAVPDGAAEDR
jgi:uncharacterized protein (TIGR00730 family)